MTRRRTGPARTVGRETRLQRWLDEHGFTSAQLEEKTGISRQSMTRIRNGGDVRRKTMMRILRGALELSGVTVTMDDLFDLDPNSPYNRL